MFNLLVGWSITPFYLAVRAFLNEQLPTNWVGHWRSVLWPAWSPDVSRVLLFVRVFIKNHVCMVLLSCCVGDVGMGVICGYCRLCGILETFLYMSEVISYL